MSDSVDISNLTSLEVSWMRIRTRLEPFLLDLHRTIDADGFWAALQHLLDAAFSNHSIVAALRISEKAPPVFYYTHHQPHHTYRWFTETLAAHPCYAHLMAHPGTPVLRLSDVLPESIIHQNRFYLTYMRPEAWHHGMAFVFWTEGKVSALIPVNRTIDQPDFSDEEYQIALWLHPRIEVALHRIYQILPVAEAHSSLTAHLADLPRPTLRMDWDLKPTFTNRTARDLIHQWRVLENGKTAIPPPSRVTIPRAIRQACQKLKQLTLAENQTEWPPSVLPAPTRITHPASPLHTALIRTTLSGHPPLGNPGFWIHFNQKNQPTIRHYAHALEQLSPAERAVATLVPHGLTNDEIAIRIYRSLSTVKCHLQSIYRKLGVHNRASLIALLNQEK